MSFKEFLLSPMGEACFIILRMFLISISICGGVALFNFKKLSPFFTIKRIISLFLFTCALNILIRVMFF